MGFIEDVKQWSERTNTIKSQVQTEEAVKHSLVMPFLKLLGYDVHDPAEVIPEFTADIGIKKGEKVDYAIVQDGIPQILIEVKFCGSSMDCHTTQLYRYFVATKAKFAILTDGIMYQFYSDLDEPNIMDSKPFLTLDLGNINEASICDVEKFHKDKYDITEILTTFTDLRHIIKIKEHLSLQLSDPSNEFTRLIVKNVYDEQMRQQVAQYFKLIVKRSFAMLIDEAADERIKAKTIVPANHQADLSISNTISKRPEQQFGNDHDAKTLKFFKQLLDKCNTRTDLFKSISPTGKQGFIDKTVEGFIYEFTISKRKSNVAFIIARKPDNQKTFDLLHSKKAAIESLFGEPLEWERKEDKKHKYVYSRSKIVAGLDNENMWPQIQDDLVDRMVRLEKAFKNYVEPM